MKYFLIYTMIFIITACSTPRVNKSEVNNFETDSMDTVFNKIDEKIKAYGKDQVLVVFDIDNTILTMNNMLGSDQWFSWQEGMFFKDKAQCEKYCVAKSFDEMLEVQGKLFALAPMITTEIGLAEKIIMLQKRGVKIILLTSRGSEFRNSTELQIKKNGFDFSQSAIGSSNGFAGTYLPYSIENLADSGLNDGDKTSAKLSNARAVTYNNGIYMTAGQHKGVMLKTLLHKTNANFRAIIFADDHKKHTDRMSETFKNQGLDLSTFRYSKIDPAVKKFQDNDKSKVNNEWKKLKTTIESIYR